MTYCLRSWGKTASASEPQTDEALGSNLSLDVHGLNTKSPEPQAVAPWSALSSLSSLKAQMQQPEPGN